MGRQSARLWHEGKDHKDFWKLIEEENFQGLAWRMHWQIYKGDNLLWEKLPPNFLLFSERRKDSSGIFAYESVTGKIFTYLGFLKSYTGVSYRSIKKVCKVGKYVFADCFDKILYTENCYAWKELNIKSLGLSTKNFLVTIENYNGKLLIYSYFKISVYDCEKEEVIEMYESSGSEGMNLNGFAQYDGKVSCIKDTAIVIARLDSNDNITNKGLLVFKEDKLVKTFPDESRARCVAKNERGFYLIANSKFVGQYGGDNLFFSTDGMSWDAITEDDYGFEYVFTNKEEVFLTIKEGIFKYLNGETIEIENNVGADLEELTMNGGFFLLSDNDYIYANDFNGNLIRFKDFTDDSSEILIEGYPGEEIISGIYVENWEG